MAGGKFMRHPYLWFSDGNVLLFSGLPVASSKECVADYENHQAEKVLFKVHKSVLANNSKSLADMFSLKHLHGDVLEHDSEIMSDEEDLGLGCTSPPLVPMMDSCADIQALLMAIYKPFSLPLGRRDTSTPLYVDSLMGMLDKYQCDDIRSHIISHIVQEWPRSLSEWIDAENEGPRLMVKFADLGSKDYCPPYTLPEPAAALRFALKYGGKEMKIVLPAMLCDLVRCSPLEDWDEQLEITMPIPLRKGARWYLLSAEDLIILWGIKSRLTRLLRGPPLILPDPTLANCTSVERDEQQIKKIRDDILMKEADDDVLYILARHIERIRQVDLCNECVRRVRSQLFRVRETIWQIMVEAVDEYDI